MRDFQPINRPFLRRSAQLDMIEGRFTDETAITSLGRILKKEQIVVQFCDCEPERRTELHNTQSGKDPEYVDHQ